MFKDYAHLISKCRPVTIAKDDGAHWGRFGGNAPRGVEPPFITNWTRYFATIPAGDVEGTDLSFFISIGYDPSATYSMLDNRSIIHSGEVPMVQFVFHKPAPRREDDGLGSELSGHGLIIGDEIPDSEDLESDTIWTEHKIGGYPFFMRPKNVMLEQWRSSQREGYLHLMQFSFPGGKDGRVRGSWPFADFDFHVLTKEVGGKVDFRYFWA